MVGCVGNAPTLVRLDIRFTGGSRSLRGYQPEMVAGRGMRGATAPTRLVAERSLHGRRSANRTTIGELMRLLWFSTFPRFGKSGPPRLCTVLCSSGCHAVSAPRLQALRFAHGVLACEASDLLNDRAAHEFWWRGRESNPLIDGL